MHHFEWAIEDVVDGFPALSLEHAAAMAVLLMRAAGSQCRFMVNVDDISIDEHGGDSEFALDVVWNAKTEFSARRMEKTDQRNSIVERAAIAVASLLICH